MNASFYIVFLIGLITGALTCFLSFRAGYTKKVLKLISAIKQLSGTPSKRSEVAGLGEDGHILFHLVQRIVSELKAKIADAENERSKLTAILDSMAEGILAVDAYSQILLINPSAQSIFSIPRQNAIGKSLLEAVKNETLDSMMSKAIQEKTSVTAEIEISRHQKRYLQASAIGISHSDDEKVCGILVLFDLTEIRKLEGVRRDFVANVSHELRTPITSILGFTETLLSDSAIDPKRARHFLKLMEEDAIRLGRLIDDLLELSKIESKNAPLRQEPTNLADEIHRAILSLEPSWKQKKIKIHNHVLENQMLVAPVDRDQIKQVILNLLDNAVKFNKDNGEIFIDGARNNAHIEISIRDTGIGIPNDLIPRIFERFFRVDKARSRELGGTGLGLAIVKHIIEAHNGSISCSSEPGRGSVFSFSIPIR